MWGYFAVVARKIIPQTLSYTENPREPSIFRVVFICLNYGMATYQYMRVPGSRGYYEISHLRVDMDGNVDDDNIFIVLKRPA